VGAPSAGGKTAVAGTRSWPWPNLSRSRLRPDCRPGTPLRGHTTIVTVSVRSGEDHGPPVVGAGLAEVHDLAGEGHRLRGELLGRGAEEPVVVALGGHRPAEAEGAPSSSGRPTSASRMPMTTRTGRLLREAVRPGSGGGCRWSWLWSPFSSPRDVMTAALSRSTRKRRYP
jgi:hypothetical protein